MYLVYQDDTPIFSIDTNNKEEVSKALINYFKDDYLTIYKICNDGTFLFYDYVECEFSIKETSNIIM